MSEWRQALRDKGCMRIPGLAQYPLAVVRHGACPVCGHRVNKPNTFLRILRGFMFRDGTIPDEGAEFSPVHPRCIRRYRIDPEYVFSAEAVRQLEAQ